MVLSPYFIQLLFYHYFSPSLFSLRYLISSSGMCGWGLLNNTDYRWELGRNLSEDGYPNSFIYDHTLGTAEGHFLYVDKGVGEYDGPAVALSPTLHDAYVDCGFTFW